MFGVRIRRADENDALRLMILAEEFMHGTATDGRGALIHFEKFS